MKSVRPATILESEKRVRNLTTYKEIGKSFLTANVDHPPLLKILLTLTLRVHIIHTY